MMEALPWVITIENKDETIVESEGQGENLGYLEDVDTQEGRFGEKKPLDEDLKVIYTN